MANKRPPLSFPELEGRGRGAILRSAEELKAEQAGAQLPQTDEFVEEPTDKAADTTALPDRSTGSVRARTHARTHHSHSLDDRAVLLDEVARRLQSKSR